MPFIDVYYLWGHKRIPDAHYLDVWSYDFNEVLLTKIIQKNQEAILYSSRGGGEFWLSPAVAQAVIWGYENIYYYKEGLPGWEKAGYPIDNEKIEVEY